MSDSIFFENYKIKSGDVDKNSKIKFHELVNYMQESAWNNAVALGYSTYDLLKKNISWVLNQQFFDIIRIPEHGETIKIETWPSGMDRFFVYRNFRIFDEKENLIAKSFSKWVVLDIIARKMIAIPQDIAASKIGFDRNNEEHTFERMKFDDSLETKGFPFSVGWSDLDVNGHINNKQYFKWITDALDENIQTTKSIKTVNIIFKSEGKLGERLSSNLYHTAANTTRHRVTNLETQKDLVIADISFNKN